MGLEKNTKKKSRRESSFNPFMFHFQKWKEMSKEDKEDYKTARLPEKVNLGKRKISDNYSSENVTSKLARFAASKE